MKFLRNRLVNRTISIFFLLVFIQSIFLPNYSFALMSGPYQPEYTSYEGPNATDMVNLLSGDFNFNLPVLTVPGPEGSFSLPLSYHAAIGPDQEASWVGLGWNINAGAIIRSVNQYPDDASGEPNYVTVKDLTGSTYWSRTYNHPFKESWNSETGYYGNINLMDIVEVEFGNKTSVGIVGIHVGDNGVNVNGFQMASAIINIASFGVGSAATTAVSVAKQVAVDMAIQTAVNFAMPVNTPGLSSGGGYWGGYNRQSTKKTLEFHTKASLLSATPIISKKKLTHYWMDKTRTEDMYGLLYLGQAPVEAENGGTVSSVALNDGLVLPNRFVKSTTTNNKGAASDINFISDGTVPYIGQNFPTSLATDSYTVSAAGVSGSITPYRMEIGMVAMPNEMTSDHTRYAFLPYLSNYKVPFIYETSPANRYYHHIGNGNLPTSQSQYYYGLSIDNINGVNYVLNDPAFTQANRISSSFNTNKNIPQDNYVAWLSNDEIKNGITASTQTYPSKYLDFLSGYHPTDVTQSDRYKFRSNYTVGSNPFPSTYTGSMATFSTSIPVSTDVASALSAGDAVTLNIWTNTGDYSGDMATTIQSKNSSSVTLTSTSAISAYLGTAVDLSIKYNKTPQLKNGIGGYCITAADGTTYHFALPIYDFEEHNETIKVTDNSKRFISHRAAAFADTWLLTAITGSDFIDRNQNGLADDADWGYWVKMNYAKYSDSFSWRTPYSGETVTPAGDYKTFSQGKKQLYYLNSIETRSHVALFLKSQRQDGKSVDGSVAPLQLDEITLLAKEHYKKLLTAPYSLPDYSNQITTSCLTSQINTNIRGYINSNCQQRVIFSYGYDLCRSTLNAGGPDNALQGKLTLKQITVKGRNDLLVRPSYKFEYANDNPIYTVNSWDGWGMYSQSGTASGSSHSADQSSTTRSPWSLAKITTPLGAELSINYERDLYSSISGEAVGYDKLGGNLRVGSIVTRDEFGKESKQRYIYTNIDGTSSGVVSVEPEYIRGNTTYDFYSYLHYPQTPVLYGRVTVLSGKLINDQDFYTRQVYEFETPHKSMITSTVQGGHFKIDDRTSKIGKLKSVKVYDNGGVLTAQSDLNYTEQLTNGGANNYQGIFSESTLLLDASRQPNNSFVRKMNRTTIVSFPYALQKISNQKDGFTSEMQNINWDLISGSVLETLDKSSLGVYIKTVRKPAHQLYPEMGSKANNLLYKNMLTQDASVYTYKSNASGSSLSLISASVQTWSKDWANYRYYNGTGYIDQNEQASVDNPVWRKGAAYVWKGDYSRLQPDGTQSFSIATDDFNFTTGATNSSWQYLGEIERFDHFGMPLQTKDLSNIHAATRMGYNERTPIASASNAELKEIAFSSAEDLYGDKPFFGGEVGLGNGTVKYFSKGQTTTTHTGDAVVALTTGYSFVFNTANLIPKRNYRASVWTNNTNGRLYYKINGGSENVSSAPVATKLVNGWYRLDIDIPAQSSAFSLEIGVKSAGGEVYFDDFRFQPSNAEMSCYVFPPSDFEFTAVAPTYLPSFNYVLNNDNFFTKYEYNERGTLIKTYSESFKYGVKLISESKDNYRRSHINQ
jgi:hypothetical protein